MSGQNKRREKFTPGPWNTDETGCEIVDSHGQVLGFFDGQNTSMSTDISNADLCASAPDMYEELQRAVERFDELSKFAILQGGAAELLKNDVERIEKLLQKARGEA